MTTEELDGPSLDGVGGHYHKALEMYEAAAGLDRGAIRLTESAPIRPCPAEHIEEMIQARRQGYLS